MAGNAGLDNNQLDNDRRDTDGLVYQTFHSNVLSLLTLRVAKPSAPNLNAIATGSRRFRQP